MRCVRSGLLAVLCCVLCSGCGSADVDKLRAELEQVRAESHKLELDLVKQRAENERLEAELADARKELEKVEEIKEGYEAAREKFKESLSELGPLLGSAASGLPAFEELKDSDWIGKFSGGGELPAELKALGGELKGLLGDQGIQLELPTKKPTEPETEP